MFVFTGYLDESGTHGSGITVMGGLLARADQWKLFEIKFEKIQAKHKFRVFHAKKFKHKSGDFKGWSDGQCRSLLADLPDLIATGLTDGVAITLHDETFYEHYRGKEKTGKARLDSKYGLCFRMCLLHFVLETAKRIRKKKFPELHIVIEGGHPNVADAQRIFDETRNELEVMGCDMLKTLTIAPKDHCGELMMADFIAHTTYSIKASGKPEPLSLPPFESLPHADRRQLKKMTSVQHFESTPQGLANIRAHVIEMTAAKRKRPKP